MKGKFFSFKKVLVIFAILLGLSIAYLSAVPTPNVQEIHKEIKITKQ